MMRFLAAMVALSFVLAASLTGCSHSSGCGADFCVCDGTGVIRYAGAPAKAPDSAKRADPEPNLDPESDLVSFGGEPGPEPDPVPVDVDGGAPVATDKYSPAAGVADDDAVFLEPDREPEEDFSEEEMARRIREHEESVKGEPEIIQEIIAEGYDAVPSVISEEPALEVEIAAEAAPVSGPVADVADVDVAAPDVVEEAAAEAAIAAEAVEPVDVVAEVEVEAVEAEAPLRDMAADYREFMDIEAYAAEEPEAPAVEPVAEVPETPAIESAAVPVAEPVAEVAPAVVEEEVSFLLPPPLSGEREIGTELSLEGFDDMDLEYFGAISESLLEDGGEG